MQKLVNDPADVVVEALAGMAAAHPELRVDGAHRVVRRADAPVTGKVGVVSGVGSGHEPLHAGFVGPGMLDAACSGGVFTSPVPDAILAATRYADGGAGVLHIVKNYTGDVMNFEMPAELAAAEGLRVESVPATNLTDVMTLDTRRGDELELWVWGPQASDVLSGVADLADRDFHMIIGLPEKIGVRGDR